MTTQMLQVGQSPPRTDGKSKVVGSAQYIDDITLPNMWFGQTVRSEVPHGMLRAIEQDAGFDWREVVVVTAADLQQLGGGENVIALIEDDQPALVAIGRTIRHVDEPVALVAAPTKALAIAAAKHIRLIVDPLPAVLSIDDALAANVQLYGSDNVFRRLEIKRGDHIDAALSRCEVVIDNTYITGAQEQLYIEPQGMIAQWRGDGSVEVLGSMQCPYYIHKALTRLFGMTEQHVVIAQTVTGGGFGGKEEYPSILAAHCALLAKKAGCPVKMIYERAEDIAATTKRHPARVRHQLGLMRDGRLVAAKVDVVLDAGAYVTLSPVVLSRAILHAAGPYRFDHVQVIGRAVATNTPPHGAFRGFGAPQTTFAYERQLDHAAKAIGMDPLQFRYLNRLRSGDMTATGQVLDDSTASTQVLDKLRQALADATELQIQPHPRTDRSWGIAFYFHGAGFTGSGESKLKSRAMIKTTGSTTGNSKFEVYASTTDIGQGMNTTFAQIAADALGVKIEDISIVTPRTDQVPDSGPTVASRTCMVVGGLVARAAKQLRLRLQAAPKANEVLIETAEYTPPANIQWDDVTYTGSAYPTYGWAGCAVELSVDRDTYEVTLHQCIHVVDVGKAIHPVIVRGQIEGGTVQALGWALLEDVQYQDGKVKNTSLSTYVIPTSTDIPTLQTILVEVPYQNGPFGAKGVGEIPMDGPAAAVANAVSRALNREFNQIPILPERIEAAMRVVRGAV